mmetsp:Transcript_38778/g.79261  ORF Transcript_38778/g.79261 Transcript_38778/m.79261 type:complete len:85 (+) Transcript_38778:2296-2550(+)
MTATATATSAVQEEQSPEESPHAPSTKEPTELAREEAALRQPLPPPTRSWKTKLISQLDLISLVFFPVSYTIFFSVMLATRDNW